MTRWYVADMDRGVLRVEPSRRAAVDWWLDHTGALAVLARFAYAPGYYSYTVGNPADADDGAEIAIVRQDKLDAYGLTVPAPADGGLDAIRVHYPDDPTVAVEGCAECQQALLPGEIGVCDPCLLTLCADCGDKLDAGEAEVCGSCLDRAD